ncbi:rubrerythrin family protein [bacterium]|nr:rubrerythrin family protein [bacterium]
MVEKIKGSRTEQILINAFAGESQARNRYTYFAKAAKEEGYEQISAIFLATAENELEHAKLFYKHVCNNSNAHVDGFYPFELGTTEENLKSAIAGEEEEFSVLYYNGELIAKEEGFDEISDTFRHVRVSEQHHANRYKELYEQLVEGTLFKKNKKEEWICRKCGYVAVANEPPHSCPACCHPRGYFELLCEKY